VSAAALELGRDVEALAVDEPPAPATRERAADLAARIAALELPDRARARARLAAAATACLESCAAGRVRLVLAVPHLVAGLELLARPGGGPAWETALAGATYEIETLLPGPERPDVDVGRLSRGPRSRT
jgi:hypothetical protein